MTTNVPQLIFNEKGVNAPAESDILKGTLDDIDSAFGGELNRNLETPQGQLASSLSAIIADKNNQIVNITNQVHPDYATGLFQDAIAKIYFLERKPATHSTATCTITGLSGTIISNGFLVKDQNNNVWMLTQTVTIGQDGTVNGNFICTTLGNVSAKANTINQIYQSAMGVDRITNPLDAVPGQNEESRNDFAYRRQNSVALNSHGTPQAVYASVFDLDGVYDVFVYDNVKDTPINYGSTNYTLTPHSVYIAVVGGDSGEIADTIWRKTGNGCNYNGNTQITVYDKSYEKPYPEYKIQFMRPDQVPIFFSVTIEDNQNFSNQSVETLKQTIVNAFYGADGSNRERIAGHIHATKYISAIVSTLQNIHLINLKIGLDNITFSDFLELGIDQYPSVSEENIIINYSRL